ncbi:hypothetical protein DPMN_191757 [Dreissena polymorpha]|uniref:Uncharacterized protein n=1 Tax=Dreissena polymorpha TaxID=45954 RepID=A0A9D3Y1T9_DREPO|nr:hypothetical protein DPMN_191757 [Dreissena polymorpha]
MHGQFAIGRRTVDRPALRYKDDCNGEFQSLRHPDTHLGDLDPRSHRLATVNKKRRRGSRG